MVDLCFVRTVQQVTKSHSEEREGFFGDVKDDSKEDKNWACDGDGDCDCDEVDIAVDVDVDVEEDVEVVVLRKVPLP